MNTKGVLIFSVAANFGLLAVVGFLLTKQPTTPPTGQGQNQSSDVKPSKNKSRSTEKNLGTATTNTSAPKVDWHMVESEDYRQYIANLRSIGCPEETIRDIITADVNKLFEARRKQMQASSTNKFEFWKSGSMFSGMMDENKIKQQQEMAKEKRELLKTLLGVEPEEKADMASLMNPFQDMLDFLPDSKQAKIIDLMQSYQAKAMKNFKDGAPDATDMKQMQKVQKEMEIEMAKILTPEEMENYQLRLSQTSMMMRMQLASFDSNEQEFREIFKLRKKFDDENGVMGMGLAEDKDKMKTAQKELNDQVKGILGPDRYADYERSQDYTYQAIAKVAQREGLPKEAGIKVYDMRKAAEEEAQKVRANKSLSAEQRKSALQGIRTETERSMAETLGQKGFESYQKQPTAYWLHGISPNPKSTETK